MDKAEEAEIYLLGAIYNPVVRPEVLLRGVDIDWFTGERVDIAKVLIDDNRKFLSHFVPLEGTVSARVLWASDFSQVNWEHYYNEVQRLAKARQTAVLAEALRNTASESGDYENYLDKIREINEDKGHIEIDDYAGIFQQNFEDKQAILRTGFPSIDNLFPIYRGEYVVIAGRPSAGKTSFITQVLMYWAKNDISVLYFSLDDYINLTIKKLLCHYTGATQKQVLDPAHKDRALEVCKEMQKLPLKVAPSRIIELGDIRRYAEAEKRKNPALSVIVVDHLTKIRVKGNGSNYERTTRATNEIYALCKELDVTMVALSQLNREVEKDSRPIRMSDMRDSGAIEEDASKIIAFDPDKPDERSQDWIVVGNVLKNKTGAKGAVKFRFTGPSFNFEEVE